MNFESQSENQSKSEIENHDETDKVLKGEIASQKKTQEKIYIKFFSYDFVMMDALIKNILQQCKKRKIPSTCNALPTEIKTITLLKAHFIHKRAKESYEKRIHKRLLTFPAHRFDCNIFYNLSLNDIIDFDIYRK
jgi:ribosomal protein S10